MKLTISQMMALGAIGTAVIVFLAMMNWRRAVHAALIVALLEGAIRKWVFPQGSELVYFFKDIILLGAYIKFFMFPDPDVRCWRLRVPGTFIACVSLILVFFGALNPNIGSAVLAVYGLKIYLWYIPLAFMVPLLFRDEQHLTTLFFRYSLFAIPICLLGVAQFFAGPDSPINTYATSDLAGVQTVATFGAGQAARARITGTFSYIGGHNIFVVLFFIISLCLFLGMEGRRKLVLLFGNLPLLLANAFMTGSRYTVFSLLGIAAIVGLTASMSRVGKARNTFIYMLIGFIVAAGGVTVFAGKAIDAFQTRNKTAGDTFEGRVLSHPLIAVTAAAKAVDFMGFGIGTSHPATLGIRRALKLSNPKRECPYYDSEIGQCMAELGWPAFLLWYAFRTMMLMDCWASFRRSPPSIFRSLALGFTCFHLLQYSGQMVLNHTANLFLCATWGFCLIPRLESLVHRPRRARQVRQSGVTLTRQPAMRGSR
ncbi:hypothetical protein [Prosthecobacter fluviatilis]|uniref:O-antigen ligase like membrane protein n=1 Tax=Prosthecobacter fluviatilis TaxID=445931 RepID=A0ABW0KQE3_9BACT